MLRQWGMPCDTKLPNQQHMVSCAVECCCWKMAGTGCGRGVAQMGLKMEEIVADAERLEDSIS